MPTPPAERAVAYIRVSKIGKREEIISPELQEHEIRQHAERFGYEIVDVIPDIDKSGRDFGKRRVNELVDRIRTGEFTKVLLWKWSRWGRNSTQSQIYLALVENAGGEVEAATEHIDPNTSYGRFNRNFFLALAELQSDQIGDGWKETQARRRRNQLPHTAAPRYGYRYNRQAQRYETCTDEAEILADAYARYVEGTASFRSLSMEWNALGYKSVKGNNWSDSSVRSMMDTGFAAGLIRERSRQPKAGQPNSKRFVAFDVWREGSQDPIISLELWERYRKRRVELAQEVPALRKPKHALSGLVFCPECGRTLRTHYSGDGGRYHQWTCREGQNRRHKPVSVSNIQAMKAVLGWLAENAEGGESVAADARELESRSKRSGGAEVDQVRKALAAVERRQVKLQDGWLNDEFDRDFYEVRKRSLADERAALKEQLAQSERRDDRVVERPTVREFQGLVEEFPGWAPGDQRAFLAEVLAGVVALPGREFWFVPRWAS